MNIKNLTEQQKEALLDLAMLAMYADGNLADAEDARVRRLVGAMGFATEYDCERQYDASVSRVRRNMPSAEAGRQHAAALARSFTTREERLQVLEVLDELVTSDRHVSLQETSLLSAVREALQG